MEPGFKRLTVIGSGLIGGSLLMACREQCSGVQLRAIDTSSETLQYILRHQLADEVSLELPKDFEAGEWVVLATHLKASLSVLELIAPKIQGSEAWVTDIGSCKRPIQTLAQKILPEQFIGGHPLAGREFSGVSHGTSLLFAGKPFIFCPLPSEGSSERPPQIPEGARPWVDFVRQGLKSTVKVLSADRHDYMMAYVSHFPQWYSVALANLLNQHEPGHLLGFHGAGLDGQIRLAGSSYAMWQEIFELNQDNLGQVLKEFQSMIGEGQGCLTDPTLLARWFERANLLYQEFQEYRQVQSSSSVSSV